MPAMVTVHHRYTTVRGRQLFYREAGPQGAPVVVLLHGRHRPRPTERKPL